MFNVQMPADLLVTKGGDKVRFECRKCKVVFVGDLTFGDLEEIQKMECGGVNGGTHKLVGIGDRA